MDDLEDDRVGGFAPTVERVAELLRPDIGEVIGRFCPPTGDGFKTDAQVEDELKLERLIALGLAALIMVGQAAWDRGAS